MIYRRSRVRVAIAVECVLAVAACHAGAGSGAPADAASVAPADAASEPDGSSAPAGIDFSIWSLQLPTGSGTSPTTIPPATLVGGYTDAYFYVASDGGQAFMDPQTGIATSGSEHCRTELREETTGGQPAAWPSTGSNTLAVAGEVVQVGGGSAGKVTVGQVFNSTDSIPLAELQYSTDLAGFQLLYEEAKGAGTSIDLQTPVALGTRYTFTLALADGVLTVELDGHQVYTHAVSAAIAVKSFYFKLGDYDQTATAGAISTTPYTIVEAFSARVMHP